MESGRIVGYALVGVVAAALTFFVMKSSGSSQGRCDVHPHISSAGLAALSRDVDRARSTAYNAAMADKKGRDAANLAGEAAAQENFILSLRDALAEEYLRHRHALDGCF